MSVTTDIDGAARASSSDASDADLLRAVRDGDDDAYGELFDRHAEAGRRFARSIGAKPHEADDLVSEAFTKVLAAVRGGSGPEDAFRPYLLTSIRRLSWRQGERRDDPTDDEDLGRLAPSAALGADDPDASIALDAFLSLPERWQTVLWHTEIEGATPAEVAPIVGLSPHATAALASRAREGLRQAFLQQHLKAEPAAGCRFTVEHLGSHVRDAVSDRDRAKIDTHLGDCGRCQRLRSELTDVNGALRGIVAPALLGAGAHQYLAGSGGGAAATAATPAGGAMAGRGFKVLAGVAAVGALVFGALGLSQATDDSDERSEPASASPSSAAAADAQGTSAAATEGDDLALPGPVTVTPVDEDACAGAGATVLPAALGTTTQGATLVDAVLFRGDVTGLPTVGSISEASGVVVRPVTGTSRGVLRDLSDTTGVDAGETVSCLTVPVASLLNDTGAWRLLVGYTSPALEGLRFVVVDRVLPTLDGVRAELTHAADGVAQTLTGLVPALDPNDPAASAGGTSEQPAPGTTAPPGGGSGSGGAPLGLPTPTVPTGGGGGAGGGPLDLDDLLPPLPTDPVTDPVLGGLVGN